MKNWKQRTFGLLAVFGVFAVIALAFTVTACSSSGDDGDNGGITSGGSHWLKTKQTTSAFANAASSAETNYEWVKYNYTNEKNYEEKYFTYNLADDSAVYYHYIREGQEAKSFGTNSRSTYSYDSESGLILNSKTDNGNDNDENRTETSYSLSLQGNADGVKTYRYYLIGYSVGGVRQNITSQQGYSEYKIQNGRIVEEKRFSNENALLSITTYTLSDNAVIRSKIGNYTLYNTTYTQSSSYNTYNTVEVVSDTDSALLLREITFVNNALSSQIDTLYEKVTFGSIKDLFYAHYSKTNTVTITGDPVNDSGKYDNGKTITAIPAEIGGKPVTRIGSYSFKNCTFLSRDSSINIPNSVTSIGEGAFQGFRCTNEWIDIDGNIGVSDGSNAIPIINIPNSVTSIGRVAFESDRLTAINVGSGNTVYSSQDGILYNKAKTDIICVPKGIRGAVTIPNSITSIGQRAFEQCTKLTSVTIPASVTTIGQSAFEHCIKLTSVTFQGTVNADKYAFDGDLKDKYLAGGPGTYTTTTPVPSYPWGEWNPVWTKQ